MYLQQELAQPDTARGAAVTDHGMQGIKGIVGSMVSKLSEETQSRWFLYLEKA